MSGAQVAWLNDYSDPIAHPHLISITIVLAQRLDAAATATSKSSTENLLLVWTTAHTARLGWRRRPGATPLPPFIQFIIIDRKEVLFGSHRGAMPGFGETALAVQHPEVTALFLDYFNVAWGEARVIKDYHHTDWELFEQIASRVETQGDSRAAEKDGQVSGPAVASTDQA